MSSPEGRGGGARDRGRILLDVLARRAWVVVAAISLVWAASAMTPVPARADALGGPAAQTHQVSQQTSAALSDLSVRREWSPGGAETFYPTDAAAHERAGTLRGVAGAALGAATIGAVLFGPLAAAPCVIIAVTAQLQANSLDYYAKEPGEGVTLTTTYALYYSAHAGGTR